MPEKNRRRPRGYWTVERCIQTLETFIETNGRRPRAAEMGRAGLPSQASFQNAVGCGYTQYCKEHGYSGKYLPVWTKESITAATDQFYAQYGRHPKQEEYNLEHGLPSHNTFHAHFGITAGEYWAQRYPFPNEWTSEAIISAFEHFIVCYSRLPLAKELTPENALPSFSVLRRHTGAATYSEFCRDHFPSLCPCKPIWNQESCMQAVDQFIAKNGRYPKPSDCRAANDLPSITTFSKKVGQTLSTYCKQNHSQLSGTRLRWTKELCIQAVDNFISQNGKSPNCKDCKSENGLPSPGTFFKVVGQTVAEYCGKPSLRRAMRIHWTKELCTQALCQFVVQNGRLPHSKEYRSANGLPSQSTFERKVGETIQEYCSRQYPELYQQLTKWTLSKVCEALDSFVERNSRPPTTRELFKENMLPSYVCFQKVVGMSPGAFIRDRYPEYYETPEREQSMGWKMQMM